MRLACSDFFVVIILVMTMFWWYQPTLIQRVKKRHAKHAQRSRVHSFSSTSPTPVASSFEMMRSVPLPIPELTQEINAVLQRKKDLDILFRQSSEHVNLSTFEIVEKFPVDASGHIHFSDPINRGRVSILLDAFLRHDQTCSNSRAEKTWPRF